MIVNEYRVSFWGDENVLKLIMVMLHYCVNILETMHCTFKRVNCVLCELYFNKSVT